MYRATRICINFLPNSNYEATRAQSKRSTKMIESEEVSSRCCCGWLLFNPYSFILLVYTSILLSLHRSAIVQSGICFLRSWLNWNIFILPMNYRNILLLCHDFSIFFFSFFLCNRCGCIFIYERGLLKLQFLDVELL